MWLDLGLESLLFFWQRRIALILRNYICVLVYLVAQEESGQLHPAQYSTRNEAFMFSNQLAKEEKKAQMWNNKEKRINQ